MEDAIFIIPTPIMLQKVVTAMDKLEMKEKDTKGDVYEYLLSKLSQAGVNGQFRTPRHIIKMMVELMKPIPEDIIVDQTTPNMIQRISEIFERKPLISKEI